MNDWKANSAMCPTCGSGGITDCPDCQGAGHSASEAEACATCGGTGKVLCPDCSDEF